MKDLVERLRAKPEHERRRIALLVSFGSTAIVAFVWATATVASGNLAIRNMAPGNGSEIKSAVTKSKDSFSQLLGAVSAFNGASSSDATLQIEDVSKERAPATADTRTVIPF